MQRLAKRHFLGCMTRLLVQGRLTQPRKSLLADLSCSLTATLISCSRCRSAVAERKLLPRGPRHYPGRPSFLIIYSVPHARYIDRGSLSFISGRGLVLPAPVRHALRHAQVHHRARLGAGQHLQGGLGPLVRDGFKASQLGPFTLDNWPNCSWGNRRALAQILAATKGSEIC